MARVKQLKTAARREEQRENWARAVELYRRALEASEEKRDGLPDLGLYNRIGDLYLRQNEPANAIEYYLKAVDRYADQQLYGGAIALCDKVLRIDPDQVEVYRRLGRLHGASGLVAEARVNFLEYASRLEEKGEEAATHEAFLELARLTDDGGLYLEVVDRLLERGDRERAVAELRYLRGAPERFQGIEEAVRERLGSVAPGELEARGRGASEEPPASAAEGEPGTEPAEEEPAAETSREALRAAEAAGDLSDALAVAARMLEAEPDSVPLHRKRVELALALEDEQVLVRAYLGLAACLERTGSPGAARTVYERILERAPAHEKARRALDRLEPEPETGKEGAVREPPKGLVEGQSSAPVRPGGAPSGPPRPEPGDRALDDMLVGFRAREDATAEDADPAARCEFGVTLREMGRLEDAIREFQAAARAPEPPVRAFELLGECFLDEGLHGVAVRVLTRALRQPGHREVDLLGVLYQLGVARQALGETEQALECFERVYSIDIDFRDVGDRMRACAL
ncbi:MAG TPA: tetratricopeptide repeat protein [Gemmatimonadota bacterium]|nr:tetratricopeptide repeat protein [Gemmatimonadota bacterium]